MNKKIYITGLLIMVVIYFSACYNNKADILELPKVSFRSEVVPIITSGSCGCHNVQNTRCVMFSLGSTVFYDAILARTSLLSSWVNGTTGHPGGGLTIDFSSQEKSIIKRWIAEGAKDDYVAPPVTGNVTYTANIAQIYTTTCKGSSCHGGLGPNLDYSKMVADKSIITTMMNSGGSSGHPGGSISLTSSTIQTFQAWIAQGMPQ